MAYLVHIEPADKHVARAIDLMAVCQGKSFGQRCDLKDGYLPVEQTLEKAATDLRMAAALLDTERLALGGFTP